MKLYRRAVLVGGIMAFAAPALAEDKPLRIVLGVSPGAANDALARLIAEKMSKSLGRPVVVENKTGAGGIVANLAVKNAPSDGSALLMTPLGPMAVFPYIYDKLEYDPFKDYRPVAQVAAFPLALATGPRVPAKTLAEYVALVRSNAAYSNFSSPVAGSLPHFFGLMFAKAAGIELMHIPYKGAAPALQALMAGEIAAAVLGISDFGELSRSGKVHMLATSGARRSPQYPDVPSFRESGYDIEGSAWYALFAPAGTPKETVDRLSVAAIDAVHQPDIQERLGSLGMEPTGLGPAELAAILRADYDKWGPIIKASGFKAD
jgi:tripartite-type tricarboxylate transporter receptor subunit TctC